MLLGERCFLLAPETKEILVLAAYTALLGYVLCGFGHRIDAVRISHGRIDEPPTKSCVLNLLGTIEGACSFPQHIGRSAHTLTPPAIIRSASPQRIVRAASPTASRPEPQSRFTVLPPTASGSPASSAAIRATLRLSSPAWFAHPRMTSSMHCRSTLLLRSTS